MWLGSRSESFHFGEVRRIGRDLELEVPAGGQVVLSLPIPHGLAAGTYWLWLAGQDSATLQPFSLMREVALPGVQAALEVQTDQPAYLAGDTVAALGAVTATQGTISGTLRLEVVRAEPAGLHAGADVPAQRPASRPDEWPAPRPHGHHAAPGYGPKPRKPKSLLGELFDF